MASTPTPGALLRRHLAQDIVVAPGAYDGMSARLVAAAGFNAVYASGGAIARAAGYPDIGLLSFTEVMDRVEKIVDASGLPVVADADTGFGGSANVERTVRIMERAGVAAFHIEDQSFPKRCGHLDDKSLVDAEEMCRKVHIARQTLADADTLVIARTRARRALCEGRRRHGVRRGAGNAGADPRHRRPAARPEADQHVLWRQDAAGAAARPGRDGLSPGDHSVGPATRRHPRHAGHAGGDPRDRRQQRAGRPPGSRSAMARICSSVSGASTNTMSAPAFT